MKGSRGRTIPVTVTKIRFLVTPRMLSKAFASEPKGSNGKRTSTPEGKMQGERESGVKEADPSYLRFDKRAGEVTTYRK
jgi:hypothetical protein